MKKTNKLLLGVLLTLSLIFTGCSNSEKIECENQGGEYIEQGLSQSLTCVMPTKDFGKECIDSSECEGLCISENNKGVCSEKDTNFGCNEILENGEIVTICID